MLPIYEKRIESVKLDILTKKQEYDGYFKLYEELYNQNYTIKRKVLDEIDIDRTNEDFYDQYKILKNHAIVQVSKKQEILNQVEDYHKKITVHDHFYLRDEFGLMGIHLSKRHPQAPASYNGPVTRTCYDLQSVVEQKPTCEYVLLRNIFDSISENENKASFTPDELRSAARQGIIDQRVIAEGGVCLDNIEQVREWGFGGVAIRGDLWNHFDVHSQQDYKELIAHFRKLRKAVG